MYMTNVRTFSILLKNAKSDCGGFSKNISFTRRPLEEEESVQEDKNGNKTEEAPTKHRETHFALCVSGKSAGPKFPGHPLQ